MATAAARQAPVVRPTRVARPPLMVHEGAYSADAIDAMLQELYPQPFTAAGSAAIDPSTRAKYLITSTGVAALTLAAPTATIDDFKEIEFVSTTAVAHTVTATGILNNGSTSKNLATFAAQKGASLKLMAYQAQWYVTQANQITFS